MKTFPESIEKLIDELSGFPGIGKKSARRMAFFLLRSPREKALSLAKAIVDVKEKIIHCSLCNNIAEVNPCPICRDKRRDRRYICIVEEASDIYAIEKTGEYNGLYHVLGGYISPLDNIGPDELSINQLLDRVKDVEEVIIAVNPGRDREITVTYLAKVLQPLNVKVTRLAQGIPIGGDVEYADEITLQRALSGRIEIK